MSPVVRVNEAQGIVLRIGNSLKEGGNGDRMAQTARGSVKDMPSWRAIRFYPSFRA
jgi:hypothetical protein